MTWYVCDMDEGVLRREATKRDALHWWALFTGIARDQVKVTRIRAGYYEARYWDGGMFADPVWVMRAVGATDGWSLDDEPVYPYPDRAFEPGRKPPF